MIPIPAFRAIQTLYRNHTKKPDSETISHAIAQTIRQDFDQNQQIHLDPLESYFVYKLGWTILFLLTFGQIDRVLPLSTAQNKFRHHVRGSAREIRQIHDAIDHAVRNSMPGIQTRLANGLTVQIEEIRGFIECERYELYESRYVAIRVVRITGNEVTKIEGQEVEIANMGMRELMQFIDGEVLSKLR